MNATWEAVAKRIVRGLGIQSGELIYVRTDTNRVEVLQDILLGIEEAGATPLLQWDGYLERMLERTPPGLLARWDLHRQTWARQVDRVLVLRAERTDFTSAPRPALEAWMAARHRLELIENERRLPFLLVALPTEKRASESGMTLAALEEALLPALEASAEELQREIQVVLSAIGQARTLTVHSGKGHLVQFDLGDRRWLSDDGTIDPSDRQRGGVVSNLPAGSVYTTVVESGTRGSLWLGKAGAARDVVFDFEDGRIVRIEASTGARELSEWLDQHSGEPRRVGHVGIGLNPYLKKPVDWDLVDEHVHGAMFLCLGENRYMGGRNESSLNVDFTLLNATLLADNRVIVDGGRVQV
jgi:leucyl aminopeptidase (aminopeptidase T)